MTTKPIDKSKKSNRRCVNCEFWPTYAGVRLDSKPFCKTGNRTCEYWNHCSQFKWNPNKRYLPEA